VVNRHHFSTPDVQLLDSRQDERERVLRDTDALLLELVLQVPRAASHLSFVILCRRW
jgi:hypothetical protein